MEYDLKTFTFGRGKHNNREEGLCINETVAYLAGEPHSDHPKCLCPVIAPLTIWVNDSCDDALRNELLRDLPWRLVGTKSTPEIEQQRAFMAADFAVRFVGPRALRIAGLEHDASKLEALPPILCAESALAAADAVRVAAAAARAAAWAVQYAAAAARAAGHDAVDAAAIANTVADAARAAVDAVWAASAAAVEEIQRECVRVIDRMIRLTEPQEIVPRIERIAASLGTGS